MRIPGSLGAKFQLKMTILIFWIQFAQKWCFASKTGKVNTTIEDCRIKNPKNILPELTSSNETAYVKNRCISEIGNLISDVIEMCYILDIPCYLVRMDSQKAFDSLDQDFLLFALKNLVSGENFIHLIKVLLNKQHSCVKNMGFTTRYFKLEKGARQSDPILPYLFILVSEVLFELIKNKDDKEE